MGIKVVSSHPMFRSPWAFLMIFFFFESIFCWYWSLSCCESQWAYKSRTTAHLLRKTKIPSYETPVPPSLLTPDPPKCKAPKSFILSSTISLAWLQPFLHCGARMSSWNSTVALRRLLKIPQHSGLSPNVLTQFQIRSDQISCSVMSNSLRPHESQHARLPCPLPTPGVHPDSRPSSQWCHPAISSSVVPFSSCPQSLPASESLPMSQLFTWGGQSTGVSA